MKLIKAILRFIKRFKFVFIGAILLAILAGAGFLGHRIYIDHNPPINLSDGANITLSSSNSYTQSQNFRAPDNWSITYAYSCTGSGNVFAVWVMDTNGSIDDSNNGASPGSDSKGVLIHNSGSGTVTQPSKGVYSIEVLDTGCTYNVIASASST